MNSEAKVAIVTGGGSGIGAEIAMHLVSEGWHVVVAEINPAHKTFNLKDSSRLLFIHTDVKSEASVKNMVQQAINNLGRIDCLINNAGLLPKIHESVEHLPLKVWNEFIATNLTGAFLCAKFATPFLKKTQGSIINIASTRALQSEGFNEPYAAAKGGLVSLTHELAISLGPEVRVNCISPGWIHTHKEKIRKIDNEQHPAGRVGKPEDIANLVSFLISDKAAFITGQNFVADGGMTVKMIYA